MISYEDIENGIYDSIAYMFKDAEISDDPYSHVDGECFIVKVINMSPVLFSSTNVHRLYQFDVVYFAPEEMPIHELDVIGQKLVEAFMWPVNFAGRYIQPQNVASVKVDKDFHVTFDLYFFDELEQRTEYKFMQAMDFEFTIELTSNKDKKKE